VLEVWERIGTKGPAEVSRLSENLANTGLAAKKRVNAVCNSLSSRPFRTLVFTDMRRLPGGGRSP
jgi:hypothetical protein